MQIKSAADTTIELMSEFGRTIKSHMRSEDGPSFSQLEALYYVAEREAPTMRDLAQYLKVKAPSATSLISELVRAKMITRKSDPHDRRQVRLAVTTIGRKTLQKNFTKKKEIIELMLARLGSRERQQLNGLLKKLLDTDTK